MMLPRRGRFATIQPGSGRDVSRNKLDGLHQKSSSDQAYEVGKALV